jgi:glycogen debranching enzyme
LTLALGCSSEPSPPKLDLDSDDTQHDTELEADQDLDGTEPELDVADLELEETELEEVDVDLGDTELEVDQELDQVDLEQDGDPPPACPAASMVVEANGHRSTLSVSGSGKSRSFTLNSTQPLRENQPANPRSFGFASDGPWATTGDDYFDALYALALEEVRECSVAAIQDGAFNGGNPLQCPPGGCFETGRKWKYVWTRDTAYAVDLGLALIDPTRARNSLEFKLSTRHNGSDLQIVQDTGSGGSYPISTDRVVWAFGARRLLHFLDGAERANFATRALEAMKNTAEHDRVVAFDPKDGLYRGEQSFLDWREQSYPQYTRNDTVHLGMSKSLSTNAGHHALLSTTASLAQAAGDSAAAARYQGWADELAEAMRQRFWLSEEQLFSTFFSTGLDDAPSRRYDLLGTSLSIIDGVATEQQAEAAVASYPVLSSGPPVMWPQQQEAPIYHNRGIWPFVTAYWLRAARQAGNEEAVVNGARSLWRGAAMNLSNMENFEMVSLLPWVDDGANSGPVINSQRQLWSVAAYLTLVHELVFGLESSDEGIRFRPFLPVELREQWFCSSQQLELNDLPYRGKKVAVRVNLPERRAGHGGVYSIASVSLNGNVIDAMRFVPASELGANPVFEVTLGAPSASAKGIHLVEGHQSGTGLFGPRAPTITGVGVVGGKLQLSWTVDGADLAPVSFTIYRDGERVADGVAGTARSWTDENTNGTSSPSHCYTIEASFAAPTGAPANVSQRALPFCYWGPNYERVMKVPANALQHVGGELVFNHGREHLQNWGDPGHSITVPSIQAKSTGVHFVQVEAGNGAGPINTGITCGVKRVDVYDAVSNDWVGGGYLMMPHLGTWTEWRNSSLVPVELVANRSYRIVLSNDERSVNMSSFKHFETYSGDTGGSIPFNRVNISELKLLSMNAF